MLRAWAQPLTQAIRKRERAPELLQAKAQPIEIRRKRKRPHARAATNRRRIVIKKSRRRKNEPPMMLNRRGGHAASVKAALMSIGRGAFGWLSASNIQSAST